MIAELGHFALVLALVAACVQGSLPILGAHRNRADWMAIGQPAALLQFLFIAVSFACLTHAYVVSDFTVLNVVLNSHSQKPLLYKISGVWGNHEGSMLLWVLILALFGALVGLFGSNLPVGLRARVISVQAWIGIAFLSFTLFTSNPFERVFPPPLDGNDLNPLLQDPGLAFHPPMLYAGYVGFSMAFSFAVAALIEGRIDAAWARWVRPWTLVAWCFLTAGIALGSWWAYYELGWGGWWFWDPVENVSFMPWLMGTALLHSAIVVEKREALKIWTVLLAILAFSLSLLGTFIVRSGLLTSVHAFATDPERGTYILMILVITIGGSLALFAIRAPAMKAGGLFAPVSREGGLVLNNLLLATATATVFLGTLYPLFVEALNGTRLTVGPPFFNLTFVPIMLPLIAACAVGPFLAWKRADLGGALSRLKFAAASAVVVLLVTLMFAADGPWLAIPAMALAAWLFVGAASEWAERVKLFRAPFAETRRRAANLPRSAYGMTLAHMGLAIVVAGATAAGAWKQEEILVMQNGESVAFAGYDVTFQEVRRIPGPNYTAEQASIRVTRDGEQIAIMRPEKRFYPVQGMPTTEAAIHTTGLADLYIALGDRGETPAGEAGWVVRLYFEPLVPWLWAGSLVMILGGMVSLSDRRLRVGVPRAKAASGPPAGAVPAE